MRMPKNLFAISASMVLAVSLLACSNTQQKPTEEEGSTQQVTTGHSPRQPVNRPSQTTGRDQAQTITYGGKGIGNYSAQGLGGDFSGDGRLISFIETLAQSQGFNRNYLYGVFSQVRNRDDVAAQWMKPDAGSPRGWWAYRDRFVNPENVQRGVQFWQQHAGSLRRAEQQFGVPAEYIVGIMGVETRWGRIFGKHRVIDALTTSALTNERRSRFFFDELENYMLMTRSERMDPLAPKGSFAGAMGYGQFMPSSFHAYAVDFNGDGIRDLWNPDDAIGSIANYFAHHGWQRGGQVAVPAQVSSDAYASVPDGFKVPYNMATLNNMGVYPKYGNGAGSVYLLALSTVPDGYKEPWIGYKNFYVITRYNHSNYYAMAVHLLAQAVAERVR